MARLTRHGSTFTQPSIFKKKNLKLGYWPSGRYDVAPDWIKNWYICDVDGNVMANYEQSFEDNAGVFKEKLKVTDHAIYGSERLGNYVKDEMLATISYPISGYNSSTGLPQVNGALTQQTFTLSTSNFSFVSGNKNYELSNHLSNVLAVVQDRKLPIDDVVYSSPGVIDYYLPAYNSFGVYYAFGASISEKGYLRNSSQAYKFGFNGVENENTNVTQLDLYSTDYRMYDSRLGRWLSIDLIVKRWESPYTVNHNNPLFYTDPLGLDPPERRWYVNMVKYTWNWFIGDSYKNEANRKAIKFEDEQGVVCDITYKTDQNGRDFAEITRKNAKKFSDFLKNNPEWTMQSFENVTKYGVVIVKDKARICFKGEGLVSMGVQVGVGAGGNILGYNPKAGFLLNAASIDVINVNANPGASNGPQSNSLYGKSIEMSGILADGRLQGNGSEGGLNNLIIRHSCNIDLIALNAGVEKIYETNNRQKGNLKTQASILGAYNVELNTNKNSTNFYGFGIGIMAAVGIRIDFSLGLGMEYYND